MNTNLDKIALELYGKIQTRFPNIKIGDENAAVLSKKTDIPRARFFEFEYEDNGKSLGTVAITLDDEDGIVVQVSGDLSDSRHHSAFKFIRSFRDFAKNRLLNFDVKNIGKDNLDKRDYQYQAKPKEEPVMPQPMTQPATPVKGKAAPQSSMMESKMYGTTKISYQDLGEARLVVKHSQPVNTDLAAGRTMHIEAIYVENADGERFKYPVKHLNGARALAEHLKAGGIPYDSIGKHITGLSEELAQLRKFKGYVNRNEALSEAMGDITNKVMERIEEVKKEINSLQRPTYYKQFAESFQDREDQMIPEEIMSDWIDRLTIRTFNEDLRTAFPYIFRLVDESEIPVKEINPDDLLDEAGETHGMINDWHKRYKEHKKRHDDYFNSDEPDEDSAAKAGKSARHAAHQHYLDTGKKIPGADEFDVYETAEDDFAKARQAKHDAKDTMWAAGKGKGKHAEDEFAKGRQAKRDAEDDMWAAGKGKRDESLDPLRAFEASISRLLGEDEESQEGENTLFSPNKATQQSAIDKFNEIMKTELKGGPEGINVIDSLKGIIDDPEFLEKMKDIDPDLDARGTIQAEINGLAKNDPEIARIIPQLDFKGTDEMGGPDAGATPPPDAGAGAPPAAPPGAPPAPDAGATPPPGAGAPPAAPPGPEAGAPPAPPMQESEEDIPFDGPYRKAQGNITDKSGATHTGHSQAKHLAKAGMIKAIHTAKKHGAKLDTTLDFGHKEMTLHDCIIECGMDPKDFGFDQDDNASGVEQMLKSVSGFWNAEEKNFTIGGTRAKTRIVKDFKDGEFKNATEEDLQQVLHAIDKMDPSEDTHQQHDILRLAGVRGHDHEVDEASDEEDFGSMMQQFLSKHQGANPDAMLDKYIKSHPDAKITRNNTSSGSINGNSASYDDAMKQMPKVSFGGQDFDMNKPDEMGGKIKGMMGGMMGKMQGQVPDQNVQFPGGQMNPADMMKGIMSKINFGDK